MKKYIFFIILYFSSIIFIMSEKAHAQTNISGIVNSYAPILSINSTNESVNIGTTSGTGSFAVGNKVMIIQMKGAEINTTESANYGEIISYHEAGNYEFATIASISASQITFTTPLNRNYSITSLLQIIRVATYTNANVLSTGLTGLAWNGTVGGVLAIEVNNILTLNDNIQMNGRGSRGGDFSSSGGNCSVQTYRTTQTDLGYKGEGIAIEPNNNLNGRGALANGGGGGNGHNAGGGGGSLTGRGARGGREWSGTAFSGWCGVQNSSCDEFYQVGGVGGRKLSEFFGVKYFMGGGGGGGQQDNNVSSAGGNGGGIIYLKANTVQGNGFSITSNGNNANNAGGDGAGGGGAGGTILIDVISFSGNLNIRANGGNGGNAGGCHGPGGAGGGGLLQSVRSITNHSNVTLSAASGSNGTQGSGSCGGNTVSPSYCSTFYVGEPSEGMIVENTSLPIRLVYFRGEKQGNKNLLSWQTSYELDNAFFSIERSKDAQNFTEIARVDALVNSNQLKNYTWLDESPEDDWNYYRLKQTDLDGTQVYSPIIVALQNESIAESEYIVYPNPTYDGKVSINIGQSNLLQASWGLLDAQGNSLINFSPITKTAWQIDLSQYPQGMYFLRLVVNGKIHTKKIITVK